MSSKESCQRGAEQRRFQCLGWALATQAISHDGQVCREPLCLEDPYVVRCVPAPKSKHEMHKWQQSIQAYHDYKSIWRAQLEAMWLSASIQFPSVHVDFSDEIQGWCVRANCTSLVDDDRFGMGSIDNPADHQSQTVKCKEFTNIHHDVTGFHDLCPRDQVSFAGFDWTDPSSEVELSAVGSHVSDRWCNLRAVHSPSRPSDNAPSRLRLLDERNRVSVSDDSTEHAHTEGLERNGDPEDEQLVIIDGWQDLLETLHQHTPSPDSLIHLEMYGLHITHHSIRITDCEATIAAIREAVQQSWRDAMPPRSVAYIHLVRPQEQRHARAVVLQMIVEIVPFGVDIPPNDVPILRRIRWHSDHSMTLETAYMRDHQTGYEILFDAHLDEWCHPRHGVQCNLHIESRIAFMAHRHHLLPGSLLEIFIHDDDRPEPTASSQNVDLQPGPQQSAIDSPHVLQERLATWHSPQVFLVMHGLFGSSLGTRYSTSPVDYQQVRNAVLHAWQDYVQPETSVTLHMVRPQDDQHPDHLHLIVEFTSPSQGRPAGYLPVLQRISWHNIWQGDTSTAVYRVSGQNTREMLAACSLAEWCGPSTRAICRLQVERRSISIFELIELQAGSLLEVLVSLQHVEDDGVSFLQERTVVSANLRTITEHTEPRNAPLDSLSTHVTDRWCDSLSSCDVQEVISKVRITQMRPNGDIVPDQDSQVPYQYRLHNGARIPGTIIPPPNWNRLPGLRYASDRGAVVRDAAHQLRVRVRSWLVPHDRFGPMYWKDCTIPAQLFLRLLDRLTSVWRPELLQGDRLRMRIVQPTPAPPVGDQARLYILLECNRPHVSTRKAILLSFQEFNSDGPSPDLTWIPYLAPEVITPQIIAGVLPMHCDPRHLIVPAGTPDRRWLAEHEERAVDDGLYLPTLRDIRRGVPTQRIEIDEATLMQTGLRENEGDDLPLVQRDEDGSVDALQLMQRSSSRSPRRGLPPSTSTDGSGPDLLLVHTYHMSAAHKLVHLDKSRPLSYSAQLEEIWRFPPHTSIVGLHEVRHPPQDLESTSQATLLIERTVDLHRQAIADDQLVLADLILSGAGTADPIQIRRVVWTRRFMTRPAVLHLFATQEFCNSPEVTCHLSVNRAVHGDFFCLRIAGPLTMTNEEIRTVLTDQEHADSSRYLYYSSPARSPRSPTTPDEGGENEHEIFQDPPADATEVADSQFGACAEAQRTSTDIIRKPTQGRSRMAHMIQRKAMVHDLQSRPPLGDITNTFDGHQDALPTSQPDTMNSSGLPHVDDLWCASPVDFRVPDCLAEPRLLLHQPYPPPVSQEGIPGAGHPHVFDCWCDSQSQDVESCHLPDGENGTTESSKVLHLESLIPAPVELKIPIADLEFLSNQLAGLQLGPVQGTDQVVKWHDSTLASFSTLPMWTDETPCRYCLYTDGSSVLDRDQDEPCRHGASAIVLIIETTDGPRWGGSRVFSVADGPTAPKTEIVAMVFALLWGLQLGDQHLHTLCPFRLLIGYDCLLAGHTAAGQWCIKKHGQLQTHGRAIALWLEQRFWARIEWQHISSHTGHPWNEAADALSWAAVHRWIPATASEEFLVQLDFPRTCLSAWLWMLEAARQHIPGLPRIVDHRFVVDVAAPFMSQATVDLQPFCKREQHESPESARTEIQVPLTFATANVLTLYDDGSHGRNYVSARQKTLMQQMKMAGLHIAGIQETRSKCEGYLATEDFHVLSAPSTSKGAGGIQLWVAKVCQFQQRDFAFKMTDLKILHSSSRRLVVRIDSAWMRAIVVVGHAPSSSGYQESLAFWTATTTAIPKQYHSWSTISLCDANARVGSVTSTSISNFGMEDENPPGEALHLWLQAQRLVAPQTFRDYHQGDHSTWKHAKGPRARLDYILCDQELISPALRTWVSDTVDLTTKRDDHYCVCACFEWTVWDVTQRKCHPERPDNSVSADKQTNEMSPHIPRDCNVHDHAAFLQDWLQHQQPPKQPAVPRKAHLSDGTWQLVLAKRYHWKRLRQLKRHFRLSWLRATFDGWRGSRQPPCQQTCTPSLWMTQHDKAVAIHARQFELLSGQVRQGVRQDDKVYYENLAAQTALVAADEGMPGLWRAIKRLLPKSRSKAKLSVRCCGPDPVDIKNHFNALEAGDQIDYHNLVERCFAHQKALCDEAPLLVPLEHIPTRIDMEQLVLRQKSNRAPGLDGVTSETLKQSAKTDSLPFFQLFLKSWLLGAEPIQFKGGMIHCIAKKQGIVNDAAKMRGIMLLDSLGKIFHGLVRKFLMGWALPRRLPCQFGGYEAQQTLYATQLLRTVSRFHTRHGLSSGVLFVDVKAAFHSLLREIAILERRQPFLKC